ncbi:adenylate/guanylate cyclase domain-containing protein [Methylobacterium sp. WL120]|uniref:adenylate/guanylate cyclase domain-containing protein n=1 Tax=Methylobacterium sp. WL120 TaxID=2603887 RepID=UPI0011CA0C33|nr:adenylate/guanylate cyclase domain-containing protein [Methylobacterium sp. WL120]TXM64011.1 tetratricopeptide repeat protein [Methylobacterium sp. WL120]
MNKTGERRLAAILITDVVGYSRMISADEDGTLRRLKALRREVVDPRIAAAHGRIVKSTGDGVLVEFPSPVRAVACAVAIQRAAADHNARLPETQALHMRIGINLGDVLAEPDGDLYGDGVNVAARLEPICEPGGLCISRAVHDQVRDRLPIRFEDRGKLALKNIARPVGVFALSAEAVLDLPEPAVEDQSDAVIPIAPAPAAAIMADGVPSPRRPKAALIAFATGAFALVAAGAGLWFWQAQKLSGETTLAVRAGLPAKPVPSLSIVVLPFANLSNDSEQEFFADGLTEDLTTDLSHLVGSFVIARNTAFTYKGKAIDVRQLGRDLGVRYALEGSVRRTGERIVLNAQLISTETGAHVWADRFEGERARLGELQVEFVARLARSLDVQLTQAEGLRVLRERTDDATASDLAMTGWAVFNRPRSKANMIEARSIFERSLEIDPSLLQGRIGLARTVATIVVSRWSERIAADTEIADGLITEVLTTDPSNALARLVKGDVLRARRDLDLAEASYRLAIDSDQNLAVAYATLGLTKILNGRAEEARPLVMTALRLSPRDPLINIWKYWVCHSHAHLGEWAEAIVWCNRSIADSPFWQAYVDLAAAYAWTGRKAEAEEAIGGLLKSMPGYTVQKWARADWSDQPTFLVEYARLVEGLRKAGLPEN